ncbi:chloroperoxidase [Methylosinus sp. R-45379]|uniref:alpha/beta fold hydrolase n=1 Tax=unclassified Methylosinus TaxID=2624500 RepID=UPI0004676E6F|nr:MULTISPECIES: alpha/beta hydrolase [unclassified Methylosinus]OAI24741.1 chloroperoxidase [Methylosinus sp. R-45379]
MSYFTASDGVEIFYKSFGDGQPIVFSHGWPLTADAWEGQMLFFGMRGYRVVAHDRRSHGRSQQVWDGNTMDRYADDLAELLELLELRDAILVGHSTGGGEVARYIGRHGVGPVAKAVLVGAVPPIMLASPSNPEGLPLDVFDSTRAGVASNRSQFFKDLAVPFYGHNRDGAKRSAGLEDAFWLQGMEGGLKGLYDCIREFSELDYSADLAKMTIPTLFIHGDDDQIVPLVASAQKAVRLTPQGALLVYPGGSHGLAQTDPEKFNHDVLAFIKR